MSALFPPSTGESNMSTKTLQEETASLKAKLSLLGYYPGLVAMGGTAGVREFYEEWKAVNRRFLEARYEDVNGNLYFVDQQLEHFLSKFPANQIHIGIHEVFPPLFHASSFLYGMYMAKLEQIASDTSTAKN